MGKPCLIRWQRNFDDALAVAETTGKPILICVDGEIASEHYAGIRYRQAETAALYEPYVPVIASTYRHSPRDYDEHGNRVPCPRFGTVTCGEHIEIEPLLFEKYFEGQRVAPRHILVEVDGSEGFDVFYAFDTKSVFETLKKGVEGREIKPRVPNADRDWTERLLSRDSEDREFIESRFLTGDENVRSEMLGKALAAGDVYSTQLMRLAILTESKAGLNAEASSRHLAWKAMTEDPTMGNLPLMIQTLELSLADDERESLVGAMETLGSQSPKAAGLAKVQRGLLASGERLGGEQRAEAARNADLASILAESQAAKRDLEKRAARLQSDGVGDGSAELQLADSFMARALDADFRSKEGKLLYQDARDLAQAALDRGQDSWLSHAILAQCMLRLGTAGETMAHVDRAMETMPVHAVGRLALETLRLYVRGKRRAVREALGVEGAELSPEMVADTQAAYRVLENHPLCTDEDCSTQVDFLNRMRAHAQAEEALQRALVRFPDSAELHLRLRNRILATRGATGLGGLEATYESMLAAPTATPNLTWFAGYASLLAAEYHRRDKDMEGAAAAYQRSIDHFEKNQADLPANQATCSHFIAIAHAALARLAMERADWPVAVSHMIAAIETNPASMSTIDGMGFTGVMTATTLTARLEENEQTELLERLRTAVEGLTTETRRPPAFDRVGPGRR
ncbi:MAG: hypothetical protein R3E96_02875 [Planctomycetota bacterium]